MASFAQKFRENYLQSDAHQVFSEGDEFWDQYNKLNPQYRSQLDPYLYYTYTPGWKDFARGWLGMRTNQDAVREASAAQAWQMLGNLQNDVFQNTYNSAESQVAREKNAGVNPDLNGDIQGDPAASIEQPSQVPYIDFLTPPSFLTTDLASIFSSASSLLGSMSQFETMLTGRAVGASTISLNEANKSLINEQKLGVSISNMTNARNVVKDVLVGLDPEQWSVLGSLDTTGKFKFDPRVGDGGFRDDFLSKYFSRYPEETKPLIRAALDNVMSDPSLMRKYYEESIGASKSNVENIATGQVFGFPTLGSEIVKTVNNSVISWFKSGLTEQSRYLELFGRLQNIEAENSIALAEFAQENGLPIQLGKTELSNALYQRVLNAQQTRKLNAEKEWLSKMQNLRRSDDPSVRAAADYLIQAYFAGQSASLVTESRRNPFGVQKTKTGVLNAEDPRSFWLNGERFIYN